VIQFLPLVNSETGEKKMPDDEQKLLNLIADLYESTSRNLQETNALNARVSALITALTDDDHEFEKKLQKLLRPLADQMIQRASGIREQTQKIVDRLRRGEI
jgi:hypothetical protein